MSDPTYSRYDLLRRQVQQALEGRFRLGRELGSGGMAVVFHAEPTGAGSAVGVKALYAELTPFLGAARFQQEIAFLQGLAHPNILPILEAHQAGPPLFFITPYLAGGNLGALLKQTGTLPLDRALAIARDMAAALDYAHAHNILHRDIKPENILFDGDRAVVCDFGVARAIERAGSDRISSSGLVIGTPEYMSPEQASGSAMLDQRTDVYALGCVLYEMLAGEPPFTGVSRQAVLARQLAEKPRSLRVTRPDVPAAVEAAVLTALAKNPAARPSSALLLIKRLGAG